MSLVCREVSARFGGTEVLSNIGLEVGAGEWVGLVGPNGSGKSTLLKRIAGLVEGDGDVSVAGRDPAKVLRREAARLVALVPQNPVVPAGVSVLDYVLLGRTPHGLPWAFPGVAESSVAQGVVADLHLESLAHRPLTSLSGGELQRAVLGRALAQETAVLLLDEPTTALDLGHAQEVMELVDRRCRTECLSVLSAMHDLTLAAQFCDRLVLLYEGRIAVEGDAPMVVTEDTLSRYYAASVVILEGPGGEPVVVPRGRSRFPPALRQ